MDLRTRIRPTGGKRHLKVVDADLDPRKRPTLRFALVGYLVEKMSETPYKDYIRKNIWEPLEMSSTNFSPTPQMEERIAVPYVVDAKTGHHEPALRLKADVWPAGIVYGTVLDQANWLIANLNGGAFKGKRLLSKETLELMHTRQFARFAGPMEYGYGNETTGYGLTWIVTQRGGERYFAHSGSVPGYTTFLLGNLDRKLGFAILTNGNRAHRHIAGLAERALDLLADRP